ncbi:MAG: hypothetical protein K8V75_08320, partial [Methanobrevibacter woesei]|nr:hypothetical protein [Methanobrevibacter woesei]
MKNAGAERISDDA